MFGIRFCNVAIVITTTITTIKQQQQQQQRQQQAQQKQQLQQKTISIMFGIRFRNFTKAVVVDVSTGVVLIMLDTSLRDSLRAKRCECLSGLAITTTITTIKQ